MFNRVFLYALVVLIACTGTIGYAEENEAETGFYFAPLPSFNDLFSALDYLEIKDYSLAVERETYRVAEEVYPIAFALGVQTADAVLATKSRDQNRLRDLSQQMIAHSRFLGLSEEILKLGDELQNLIQRNEWSSLEEALDKYKQEVELALYDTRQYDLFTLMQLGGWTQGLNRISFLLVNNYQVEKTSIVDQKGILNSLINNLNQSRDRILMRQDYYQVSMNAFQEIREIIYSREDGLYSMDDIRKLLEITQSVKKSFI